MPGVFVPRARRDVESRMTKTCQCGNDVELSHNTGRHKGSDFGVVGGRCEGCGRMYDDIRGEWVLINE